MINRHRGVVFSTDEAYEPGEQVNNKIFHNFKSKSIVEVAKKSRLLVILLVT